MTTATHRGYAELPRLISLMTGDDKHLAAAESTVDVLWVLYDRVLDITPENFRDETRDRFLLSKGHGPMAYYAVLTAKGFLSESELPTWSDVASRLGRHPDRKRLPGVEISSGSLGHGLPIAVGRALADRMDGRERRTFCLMGDGETDEGSVFEAAALAGRLGLSSLVGIVDANGHQGLEAAWPADRWERFDARFAAAGWDVVRVDGHDHDALRAALTATGGARPRVVVAHTLKGRGVSFMEGRFDSHYKSVRPHDRERVMTALAEGRIAA